MKIICKVIMAIALFSGSMCSFAQGVDVVTLTTTGEGKNKDEAVTIALRNAIEQAFGTFISSKTEIVNDDLMKDEIVSIANGNIRKYDILSYITLPNGNAAVSVKSEVSVSKLTSFSVSKGINVEYKGSLFAANAKLKNLYAQNEYIAIGNLVKLVEEIIPSLYTYSIHVLDPKGHGNLYEVGVLVGISYNNNIFEIQKLIKKTLQGVGLRPSEREQYEAEGRSMYWADGYMLRNKQSIGLLFDLMCKLNFERFNFDVNNGTTPLQCRYEVHKSLNNRRDTIVGCRINFFGSKGSDPNVGLSFPSNDRGCSYGNETIVGEGLRIKKEYKNDIEFIKTQCIKFDFPNSLDQEYFKKRVVNEKIKSGTWKEDYKESSCNCLCVMKYTEFYSLSKLEKIMEYSISRASAKSTTGVLLHKALLHD